MALAITPSSHRGFLSDILAKQAARRELIDPEASIGWTPQPAISSSPSTATDPSQVDTDGNGVTSKANVVNYIEAEETIRNDLCEWYTLTGEFGGNYIHGTGDDQICEE